MVKHRGSRGPKRRLADLSIQPELEPEFADRFPPEEIEEFVYAIDPSSSGVHRVVVRQFIFHGAIVGFAIMLDVILDDVWRNVARADCCHGTAHIHQFGRSGTEVSNRPLQSLESFEDVDHTFEIAYKRIVDEWDEMMRRWNQ